MDSPCVFVVSGGKGSSGEQIVRTALAQFPESDVALEIVSNVETAEELKDVVNRASSVQGIIVHTLVNSDLHDALIDLAGQRHVEAVDLLGPLLDRLTQVLGQKPLGKPGLYRRLHEDYFKRIEAIEFSVNHDDGRAVHELRQAEIVLIGVSRAGKTPLSMYLSTRGWKVANIPLIKEVPPPATLFEVDHRRVVGLTINPDQLVFHRRRREERLGVIGKTGYTDPEKLEEELNLARKIFRDGQFAVVDMTDKSIEEGAEEVIRCVTERLNAD